MSPTNPAKSPMVNRSRESNTSISSMGSLSSQNSPPLRKSVKLLLLGQDGVGKSAFTVRYLTRRYIGEYDPLLEGIFKKIAVIGRQEVTVEIKDTARGISWNKRANDLLWADALVLIYAITNRQSFVEIQKTATIIEQQKAVRDMPCLVIGNKKDLAHARAVTFLEGSRLANSIGGMFCEVSVSDNYVDLEAVVHHFVKENSKGLKPSSKQTLQLGLLLPEPLRAKSTSDLHKKDLEAISDNESKSGKGRALWQKLRTNNDLKKAKTKLSA